ncbi:hypothetical protein [Actinomadura gamaensis]|uniref:RNA-binding protein RO60 vWA domain-containing protein n=1 Tax=Actinomadura gamaensis TaxID=1763541 RepID=A0ABV9U0A5_9ACTN
MQALEAYRRGRNPAARVVVATLSPSGTTIGDPRDPGVLNIAGMDASLPLIVNEYLRA